jgi:hypothetical protein
MSDAAEREKPFDIGQWKQPVKSEHPRYRTSNNVYGAKPVNQYTHPKNWTGRAGAFTKTFNGFNPKDTSLTMNLKSSVRDWEQ